jgi:hypothetical protein
MSEKARCGTWVGCIGEIKSQIVELLSLTMPVKDGKLGGLDSITDYACDSLKVEKCLNCAKTTFGGE